MLVGLLERGVASREEIECHFATEHVAAGSVSQLEGVARVHAAPSMGRWWATELRTRPRRRAMVSRATPYWCATSVTW